VSVRVARDLGDAMGALAADPAAALLAGGALALMIGLRRLSPRVPGTIIALVGGTAVVWLFGLDVETIGTRFGGIPSGLPDPHIPKFEAELVPTLLRPALTVALLGAIESLMSAVVADRMSGDRHNPNVELMAQGLANIASPIFGGLPATGAIARTATNIRSGARTPVAGMVHAITLLIVLLIAAPLARHIPMAVLASILFIVAWNMGEWREIPKLLKLTKTDISVWLVTFALTVFADLTLAVEVGMVLAALLFIRRVAVTTTVSKVTKDYVEAGRPHILQDKDIPPYVAVYRIHGPFLFGMTDKISELTDAIDGLPPIVIIRLRNMTAIDATGLRALEDVAEMLGESGRTLVLCGAREQPSAMMRAAEFHRRLGDANICENIEAALARAARIHRSQAA
jgi:SulP family sulfate permease